MTERRLPRCTRDPDTGDRVTEDGDPCEHDHCVHCGIRHTTATHPLMCQTCVTGIREDLTAILAAYHDLAAEAQHGTSPGGQLLAAAPIPGGDALVLLGPASDREAAANRWESASRGRLKKSRLWAHFADDHLRGDAEPPISLLGAWEDAWRSHLQNPSRRLVTVPAAVSYLTEHLTLMAQLFEGPDPVAFARQVAGLRASLEAVLHDERTPERGVECFECGVRLVRRVRPRRECEHETPARRELAAYRKAMHKARRWIAEHPDTRPSRETSAAALPPSPAMLQAAGQACATCARRGGLGGVDDPTPGLSWECPGCRKKYTPGEYATAVRRDLATTHEDEDGHQLGWTTLPIAAEAAAEQSGRPITANTIRTWATRALERDTGCGHVTPAKVWLRTLESYPEMGEPWPREVAAAGLPCSRCFDSGLAVVCQWEPGRKFGVQLVFWPDVADRISEARRPGRPASGGGQVAS